MSTRMAIDEVACFTWLRRTSIGRVALCARALPRIVPAHYVVRSGSCISAALEWSPDLASSVDGAVVALEADGFDEDSHGRWCVHVVGRVTERQGATIIIEPVIVDGYVGA